MATLLEEPMLQPDHGAARATVRIAIAGCGVVGSAVVRELAGRKETLALRHGLHVTLAAVLVRDTERRRDARLEDTSLGTDVERFLAADADVLIEAIGGVDPARRIVESALRRGMTVLTANKALIATHGTALVALATRHGATLRYDAAVGGGVPVLRLIDDALGAGTPSRIRGVLNGTTNFVLSALEDGHSYDSALAVARRRGFAEADVSRDLDGRDAAAKIAIIAWAAWGVAPETAIVRRTSLLPDPTRYSTLARRLGVAVRQVAECALVGDGIVASVEPLLVTREGPLAQTRDEQNRVEVHTGWTAPLCASGPGAGGLPTATALLSDLVARGGSVPRRAAGFSPAQDERRCRWILEVRHDPSVLHHLVPGCCRVHTNAAADLSWVAIADATADEVRHLVALLEGRDAAPIVIRVDDACEALLA